MTETEPSPKNSSLQDAKGWIKTHKKKPSKEQLSAFNELDATSRIMVLARLEAKSSLSNVTQPVALFGTVTTVALSVLSGFLERGGWALWAILVVTAAVALVALCTFNQVRQKREWAILFRLQLEQETFDDSTPAAAVDKP